MGASQRRVRTVQVNIDPATDRDLASLLGRRSRFDCAKAKVPVAQLLDKLGLNYEELRVVIEAIVGPIGDRARAKVEELEQKEQLWELLNEGLGTLAPRSVERIRAAGVPGGDLQAHRAQVLLFLSMVQALPLVEPTPAPIFSWLHTKDPHALDSTRALHKWLGMVLAEIGGHEIEELSSTQIREEARSQGLLFDRLSTPTLSWSLQAQAQCSAGRLLSLAFAERVPLHLSSSWLDSDCPRFCDRKVLWVENPSVVEWMHVNRHSIPVVCSSGWPSTDAQRLLGAMVEQGIELHYAGDFDNSGLKIARYMHERFGARIRMSPQDYLAGDFVDSIRWQGEVPATPWCTELQGQIEKTGFVRYQEDPVLLERLLLL